MTDVPLISITHEESDHHETDDETTSRPNISECHTDVEDLESDQDRNTLISVLKKNVKCNGAVTDVEDFDDSDDNVDEPELNYGPGISLNEFLDQGCIDESSNLIGNDKKKLVAMHSVAKSPSPTAFNLNITFDVGGLTDLEDLEASDNDADENERVYSDDDKVIVLEDSNAVDIHDSVGNRKRTEKVVTKFAEPSTSSSSESEDEKPKLRFKPQKHYTKRAPRIEEAKSDCENIFFSDDDKKRLRRRPLPVLETPDIEVMAFDGSDNDDVTEPQFPEINISFVGDEKPKKKKRQYKTTPAPSPMLALPDNQDEGHTDVENLNSSDDDDDTSIKINPKNFIPIAVIKSDALTDVEDLSDASDDDCSLDDKPDIPLPSPVREFTVLVENQNGEPMKQTTPLPDNLLLGFLDLDADKGLTDVEDFSDESQDDADDDLPKYEIDCILDLDNGVVESSDHTTAKGSSLSLVSATPEPLTDTEDIFVKRQDKSNECRRRRPKPKHSQHKTKSNFLDTKFYVDLNADGAHTDVEDLNVDDDDVLLKDKSIKQRRATLECGPRKLSNNVDGKTDVEYMSGDDILDLSRFSPDVPTSPNEFQFETCTSTRARESIGLNGDRLFELTLPEFRKVSLTDSYIANTDVEDVQCNSETEEASGLNVDSYSRAQTATPLELNRDLDELCASQIHEIHSGAFDRVKEHFEIKDNLCLTESHTDVENFDEDGLP